MTIKKITFIILLILSFCLTIQAEEEFDQEFVLNLYEEVEIENKYDQDLQVDFEYISC
ncbi:hypothetical protein [Natronospora cellulosivora (SeqCode)]